MWHEVRGTNGGRGRNGQGGRTPNKGGIPAENTGETNTKLTADHETASKKKDLHDDETRNTVMTTLRGKSVRGGYATNKGQTPTENGREKSPQLMGINEIKREMVIKKTTLALVHGTKHMECTELCSF